MQKARSTAGFFVLCIAVCGIVGRSIKEIAKENHSRHWRCPDPVGIVPNLSVVKAERFGIDASNANPREKV
jgi:hypothetical protein